MWMWRLLAQLCLTLWNHGLYAAKLLCPWNSSGKNTGVCCHALLQGIFLTQGLNLGLLHCRWSPYHLSHQGHIRKDKHTQRIIFKKTSKDKIFRTLIIFLIFSVLELTGNFVSGNFAVLFWSFSRDTFITYELL